MTAFGAYSRYYDLLYATKDYAKEAAYVLHIVKSHRPRAKSLLDLGCGTGIHACAFAQAGYQVTAVDRSETMLKQARERAKKEMGHGPNGGGSVEFLLGDIRGITLSRRFDVITSLFHVVSYLPTNDDLHAAFSKVRQHIEHNGLFIFDFWYGPAVLTDRPIQRVKVVETQDIKIVRVATPSLNLNDNLVDVNYQLSVVEKNSGRCEELEEHHRMRYLFPPELEHLLTHHKLQTVACTEWLSDEAPRVTSWNATIIASPLPEISE
jgi:SAM-dependent methyltransferase